MWAIIVDCFFVLLSVMMLSHEAGWYNIFNDLTFGRKNKWLLGTWSLLILVWLIYLISDIGLIG